jgi:hypothetical protein
MSWHDANYGGTVVVEVVLGVHTVKVRASNSRSFSSRWEITVG